MKLFGTVVLTLVVLTGPARLASSETKAAPGFDRLKSLVGEWRGKDGGGRVVEVSYSLTAGNTAVMETLNIGAGMSMVTLYHPDKDKLMMTHYCILGNQPRMLGTGDDRSLTFSLVDATNLTGPDAPHMRKLVISFPDKDHLTHEWTMRAAGQDKAEAFSFERKK
ncbi:MAG: hypothetical protein ACREJ6_01110 [Candidatus Methylomirabilis sp.]